MATTTVNALTALTSAAVGDKVPIWDISEGQYKAITTANLLASLPTQQVITFTPANAAQKLIQITPLNPLVEDFIVYTSEATFNGVIDTTAPTITVDSFALWELRTADRSDAAPAC